MIHPLFGPLFAISTILLVDHLDKKNIRFLDKILLITLHIVGMSLLVIGNMLGL